MKLRYLICLALFSVSLIAPIPELQAASAGRFGSDELGVARYIREVLFVVAALYILLKISDFPKNVQQGLLAVSIGLVGYISTLALFRGDGLLEMVVVLRAALISLSALFFFHMYRMDGDRADKFLIRLLKFIVVISIPIAIWQVLYFPPVKGATALGSRAFGLSPNPILFSQVLAAISLFLYVSRAKNYWLWMVVCLLLAVASGGRSGMIAIACLIMLSFIHSLPIDKYLRSFLYVAVGVGGYFAYELATLSALSGRQIRGGLGGESRLENWATLINYHFSSGLDWIFGAKFGLGMNAANVVLRDQMSIGLYADNMFLTILLNFGLIGLIVTLFLMAKLLAKAGLRDGAAILIVVSLLGLTQNLFEVHIVNIVLLAIIARVWVNDFGESFSDNLNSLTISSSIKRKYA